MSIAAFSTSFGSAASTMSTTSKRPSVAKLSFQVTPGHCRLIFCDTSLAKSLKSLGSSNACGEMRLRITYVAIRHLSRSLPKTGKCYESSPPASGEGHIPAGGLKIVKSCLQVLQDD